MKNAAFIALGSNIGSREVNIRNALKELEKESLCRILKTSHLYETKPFGYKEQDNFINAAAKVETDLDVTEFFALIKDVESRIGRKERFKWGPREIDIDLLFFNSDIISTKGIKVPHPGIPDREFVLIPLMDIDPDFIHPELNQKISDICKTVTEKNIIRKI